MPHTMPGNGNDDFGWESVAGRTLDHDKFEHSKRIQYELEDWNSSSGYPTRSALEGLGLCHVTDELEAAGKLER